jgi:hypothetical protein
MADKKNDATKNLKPEDETQTTEKGLKIGVPKKSDFLAGLGNASEPEREED